MKSDIINKIEKLKKQKNAIILAHYYTDNEVQSVADCIGDSFYLAKAAKASTADIIVFCGVLFMGESAKILNPNKKVLMPDITDDCPMAHMVDKNKIAELRQKYNDLAVVCYINSTAEIKTLSDVCVTSSNAVKIVNNLDNKNILFIPDKNLGTYVAEKAPNKNVIINNGYCHVHASISPDEVKRVKAQHPNALVLSHPECSGDILELSDYLGSTAEMIEYAKKTKCDEFIICTEEGIEFKLKNENPNKSFYFPASRPCCADMKLNTLEKILDVLQNETNEVILNNDVCLKALKPLNRMLELAK